LPRSIARDRTTTPHHHTMHACTHAKVAVVMYTVVQYNYDTLWARKNA